MKHTPPTASSHTVLRDVDSRRTLARLWINPRYDSPMEAAGLTDVNAVVEGQRGQLLRRLPRRENWRVDLPCAGGSVRTYLKKHRTRTLVSRLRDFFRLGPGRTPACVEARHIVRLAEQGVPTMSLVAFGKQLARGGRLTSFLMTEELSGFTQLDDFLDERFPGGKAAGDPAMKELVHRVAELARRFHRLGYNHRDFYTCHFFIREEPTGRFDVHLIDLQRVQHRRWFRRRWIVKDLAQLAYSAPPHCIGRRERMWYIRRYLGVERLRPADKRLIRSVLARERRMRRKLGPYR